MRLARRQFRLSPLHPGNVKIVLKHETDGSVVRLSRDPQTGDRNRRSSPRLMSEFAFPTAPFAERRNDLAPREGIFGLQQVVDDLSDRLLPGPAIKALATRRPMENVAIQIMDDDIGQIQDSKREANSAAKADLILWGSSSRRTL